MAANEADRSRPGRPRDEGLGGVILATTRALVTQHGYDEVTTELIARTAGIGKQTLYRRWPGKAELVLDAFTSSASAKIDDALPTGPLKRRLCAFLRLTFEALQESGPAVRSLMATAQRDGVFRELFKVRFIEPRREALRRLLLQHEDRISPASANAAVAALFGALWYRLLLDETLDATFARSLAKVVLDGLAPRARL